MCVASATPSDTRRAHVRHPSSSNKWSVVSVSPRRTIFKAMRPWLLTGDRHADDDDEECDQLNRTNDHEADDMSNNDDDADRDVNDHNDKDDDDDNDDTEEADDDDDAEEAHIDCDVPVCKSCGNFGLRTHRDRRCPDHKCAHCGEQGHIRRFCPDVQCPHCDLFGHVKKIDCKYT